MSLAIEGNSTTSVLRTGIYNDMAPVLTDCQQKIKFQQLSDIVVWIIIDNREKYLLMTEK